MRLVTHVHHRHSNCCFIWWWSQFPSWSSEIDYNVCSFYHRHTNGQLNLIVGLVTVEMRGVLELESFVLDVGFWKQRSHCHLWVVTIFTSPSLLWRFWKMTFTLLGHVEQIGVVDLVHWQCHHQIANADNHPSACTLVKEWRPWHGFTTNQWLYYQLHVLLLMCINQFMWIDDMFVDPLKFPIHRDYSIINNTYVELTCKINYVAATHFNTEIIKGGIKYFSS